MPLKQRSPVQCFIQVKVLPQYKYYTVDSLQAKTIVTCVRIF